MKIRRYMGSNAQEAILKVKMDLGNEAVILNTRKVRQKGWLKIFSKPMVEVLAAIDEDYGLKKEAKAKEPEAKTAEGEEQKICDLENKVSSMEVLLKKIYEQVQPTAQRTLTNNIEKHQSSPKVLQLFYNNLVKNEVEAETAKKIIDEVRVKVGEDAGVNEAASALYGTVAAILGKPETIRLKEDGKPTVVMFVGPTGVGKTTTLAKIAASYALNHKKSVGMITADTYRIAAVEQLKTYAEILGMPATVIYSPGEIVEAIKLHSDKDIVLIDTAGRSHKSKGQLDELKALIQAANVDEIYLLLSTTMSTGNCREMLNGYSFITDYKLLFTKLDETPLIGVILNARYMTGKSLSYITTGQNVPDDIEVVSVEKIIKNLLGSMSKYDGPS